MGKKFSLPSQSLENSYYREKYGLSVIWWEVLDVLNGTKIRTKFLSKNSPRRQGVYFFTDKEIAISQQNYKAVTLWQYHPIPELLLHTANNKLNFYNVWDGGDGFAQSQSYTSGMLLEIDGSIRRYKCNDFGLEADFTKLAFELELLPPGS